MKNININKGSLILIVIIVISLIFANKVWQSQNMKIAGIKSQISDEEAKIDVLKNIEVLNRKLTAFNKNLKRENVEAVIEKINNFASSNNIEILSIQPQQDESRKDVYKVLPISLTVRGKYHNIGRFISRLEGKGQFFNVRQISLNSEGSRSSEYGGSSQGSMKKDLLSCSLIVDSIYID